MCVEYLLHDVFNYVHLMIIIAKQLVGRYVLRNPVIIILSTFREYVMRIKKKKRTSCTVCGF